MKKPILCLDFDGVLHSYASGWQGADAIPDPPVPGAVEACRAYAEHFQIVINSSRCSSRAGTGAMFGWLERHGFPIESIEIRAEKPPAVVALDDRALCFSGVFPPVETLLDFKPWNKQTRRTLEEWNEILEETENRLFCLTGKSRHPDDDPRDVMVAWIAEQWQTTAVIVERAITRATNDGEFSVCEAAEYLCGQWDAHHPDSPVPLPSEFSPPCAICGGPIFGFIEEGHSGEIHPECYASPEAQP